MTCTNDTRAGLVALENARVVTTTRTPPVMRQMAHVSPDGHQLFVSLFQITTSGMRFHLVRADLMLPRAEFLLVAGPLFDAGRQSPNYREEGHILAGPMPPQSAFVLFGPEDLEGDPQVLERPFDQLGLDAYALALAMLPAAG